MQTNRSLSRRSLCFVIATKKETNSNCLASFRVQQGATSISICLLWALFSCEQRQQRTTRTKTSSPVVRSSEILLSLAVVVLRATEKKLSSSCTRYYYISKGRTVDHFPTQQERTTTTALHHVRRLCLIADTKSVKFISPSTPDDPFLSHLDTRCVSIVRRL
jgi:hypothetical protein